MLNYMNMQFVILRCACATLCVRICLECLKPV